MKLPIQITSRHFELTESIENAIREKAHKLEQYSDKLIGCRVVIESPHRHKHKGVLHNVNLDITIPGKEIVVKREPHEDLYISIRDAFDAAARQLKAYTRRQRGEVKHHEPVNAQAKVVNLFPEEGYGFLATGDGREIYFHENSIINKSFDDLDIGEWVRFNEEQGGKGPQASSVEVLH